MPHEAPMTNLVKSWEDQVRDLLDEIAELRERRHLVRLLVEDTAHKIHPRRSAHTDTYYQTELLALEHYAEHLYGRIVALESALEFVRGSHGRLCRRGRPAGQYMVDESACWRKIWACVRKIFWRRA